MTITGTRRPGRLKQVVADPQDQCVKWEDAQSPAVIALTITLIACVLLAAIGVSVLLGSIIPAIVGLVLTSFSAQRILRWRCEWRVITADRLIVVKDITGRDVSTVRLVDVRTVRYKESFLSSVFKLGLCNFEVHSVDDEVVKLRAVRNAVLVDQLLESKRNGSNP